MVDEIKKAIRELLEDDSIELDASTPLIGDASPLDSMNIVNLCIVLEDISEEKGFKFDWSGETMSKSKSMFRSINDLAHEFERQQSNS
jgi:acyl carrier protein